MTRKLEDEICKQFIQALQYYNLDEFDVFHINNGIRTGTKLQRIREGVRCKLMGVIKGIADYEFHYTNSLGNTNHGYIEFKTPQAYRKKHNGLSIFQKRFKKYCDNRQIPHHVVDSAESGLNVLTQYGVI